MLGLRNSPFFGRMASPCRAVKGWRIASAVALLSLLSTVSFAQSIDGVHWTITGQTSVTFDWRGGSNQIRFGHTTSYDRTVTASTPSPEPFSSSGPYWEAKLTGLTENTVYHYSIGGGPDHTFKTPPPRGSSTTFTVYACGDIGSSLAYAAVAPNMAMIAAGDPDFVLMLGDLTYGNAHGQTRVDQHFNDVMVWSRDAAYMPVWGNHEWDDPSRDDLRNYKGRFDFPNPQTTPGAPSGGCCGEDWYWFDYGSVRFIGVPERYSGAWSNWFTRVQPIMAAAQDDPAIRVIVTMVHRPPYASGNYSPGALDLQAYMDTLGVRYNKYRLNLSGHDHNYQRSHPQHGVVHVVVGTGGSGLYPWTDNPSWIAARAIHRGALRLRFTSAAIEGAMICGPAGSNDDVTCSSGSTIDSFTIPLGGSPPSADQPPMVSASPSATVQRGSEVVVQVTASDPDGQAISSLTADLSSLPPQHGATFTVSSGNTLGTLRWTPSSSVPEGSYPVRFTAANALTGSATTTITVTAAPAPEPAPGLVERRVTASADDAEERPNGDVSLTSSDLELMDDGGTQRAVGMRFRSVTIPQRAVIRRAWLELTVDEASSEATSLGIVGESVDNASAFSSSSGSLTARMNQQSTQNRVTVSVPPWTTIGAKYQTPDLARIVQEIINRPGWSSGNSLALMISGSGRRTAEAYDGAADLAPLLHIEYVPDQPPTVSAPPSASVQLGSAVEVQVSASDPDGHDISSLTVDLSSLPPQHGATFTVSSGNTRGTLRWTPSSSVPHGSSYPVRFTAANALSGSATTTITVTAPPAVLERRVSASADDAEERDNGNVDLNSSDLELMDAGPLQRAVGIRFRSVTVPQGASISRAWLELTVDETGSATTTLAIVGEMVDNASTFSSSEGSLTARMDQHPTQNRVTFDVPPWTTIGAKYQTPDLARIVQEIVDRPGWSSGNSLALIITGSGRRIAEAYDGESDLAPLLHVEYRSTGQAASVERAASSASLNPDTPPDRELPPDRDLIAWVVPNPLTGRGRLHFVTREGGQARAELFDVNGRRVSLLHDAPVTAGRHSVGIERSGSNRLRAGVYFYRVRVVRAEVRGRLLVVD